MKKKPSVCFVGNFIGFSGALEVFRNTARHLKAAGWRTGYVYHIARDGEKVPDMSMFDEVHKVEDSLPREVLGERIASLANKFDICHHSLIPVMWRFCLKQCLKVPNVETYHSIEGWRRSWPEYKIRLGAGVEKLPDALVAVSEGLRTAIIRDTGYQVERVYNGVEVPDDVPREVGKFISYVGRIAFDKGLPDWIDAAVQLRELCPGAGFQWVGEWTPGTDPRMIELFTRSCPWLKLVGFKTDPSPYYFASRVHLMTSPAEGLPMSILEAQAHGVPCVAFDVGDIKESGCFTVSKLSDAVDLVARIWNQPAPYEKRKEMQELTREAFSASRMAQSYKRIYESCL